MIDFKKIFDSFRLGDIYYKNIHLNSVLDQIGYIAGIGQSNYDELSRLDTDSNETHYWSAFYSIMESINEDLQPLNYDEPMEKRLARLEGMLDACNTIISQIKEGAFDKRNFP